MYPILILRSEFVCLVILVFLAFMSRAYNIDKDSKSFGRILYLSIIHIVFDGITVYTVNHLDTVPAWLNWFCHVVFYLSAILYSCELANYVYELCFPKIARKLYISSHIITAAYISSLTVLKITYVSDLGTNSSAGPAAIVGYGVAFLFFFAALITIFINIKNIPNAVRITLIPMMLVLMFTEVSQVVHRSVLFTGGAITIVTVGFFFSLENPIEVFRKKAMTDALTGVHSRRSYEEDIEKLDKKFRENPGNEYAFVFCDINDLKNVNNLFGHAEGDNYITLIASAIKECMVGSQAVYRIGGDEFLILYVGTKKDLIVKELKALSEKCKAYSEDLRYTAAVATGYAISSDSYKTLHEVVKSADYAMYQNKARIKSGQDYAGFDGAKLNYVGLTGSFFGAMCAANDNTYPFITNMETNVTRISPAWKEYFGLEDEFYNDFLGMWKDRIHPDYIDGYMADVVAVVNGHKKYHHYDYLAQKLDGEYVMVSCYGAVYTDNSTGITYFTGYIINHGVEENE